MYASWDSWKHEKEFANANMAQRVLIILELLSFQPEDSDVKSGKIKERYKLLCVKGDVMSFHAGVWVCAFQGQSGMVKPANTTKMSLADCLLFPKLYHGAPINDDRVFRSITEEGLFPGGEDGMKGMSTFVRTMPGSPQAAL